MRSFYFFVFMFLLAQLGLTSQQTLPHILTPEEKNSNKIPYPDLQPHGITVPPTGSLRAPAEWEEIESLVITWSGTNYLDILAEIVRNTILECKVIIITGDTISTQNYLANADIDPSDPNIQYLVQDFNSIWVRDYGQWNVYKNVVDSLLLVDWIYNRPFRPDDNAIPLGIAAFTNLDIYETILPPYHLVNTGGNFMCDGMGTAFASELVLQENTQAYYDSEQMDLPGHNYTEIANILNAFMGIDRYITMPTLPYDGIHHIDMHLKLLDEETLLVGEYPIGQADGPQIEANLQYVLDNYESPFGTPYKVVRIPMPPEDGNFPDENGAYRTYTNCVFINKTVLVPTYEEQFDTTGLRILRENLPGYNVVGIECNDIIQLSGALHCITKEVMVQDPLLIIHQPLSAQNPLPSYTVNALVKHKSGIAGALVHYSSDPALGFTSIAMNYNEAEDYYTANIPALDGAAKYYYYIEGVANSGKTITRPITAPDGYWQFDINENNTGIADIDKLSTEIGHMYPNPSSAITVIPVHFEKPTTMRMDIIDMNGRIVEKLVDEKVNAGQKNYFINTSSYITGCYSVVLTTQEGITQQKLMVK